MIQDFYTKLSDQEKKFFYGALAFVVLAVFDLMVYRPITSRIKDIDEEIKQTKADLKRDVKFLAFENKIRVEDEAYRAFLSTEAKTTEEVLAAFLKTIETLASETGITLVKLNPAESISKTGYVQYQANVECNGKLENIVRFVHKIDTTPNLLKVVKLNMIGKKSSPDEVVVTMLVSKLMVQADPTGPVVPAGTTKSAAVTSSGSGQPGAAIKDAAAGTGNVAQAFGQAESPDGGAAQGEDAVAAADRQKAGATDGIDGPGQGNETDPKPPEKTSQKKIELVDEAGPDAVIPGKDLITVWNNFWGIKPKPKPPEKIKETKINPDEYHDENYKPKENVWERVLDKK